MDRLMLKFLNFSNKLVVHTEKLKELLVKNRISKDKITIIPLGTTRCKILDKEECKEKLGVLN